MLAKLQALKHNHFGIASETVNRNMLARYNTAPEDQAQDPHILRAIGRAWSWRRRMEAVEFATIQELAEGIDVAERYVSRQLRLAYLSPEVFKRLVFKREIPAATMLELSECAGLPWSEQAEVVFGSPG
jgi:hypothetical protein